MFPFLVDITMTQTKKMQSGDKTSTLYSFYDGQYDFNDLARRVDSGMNEHISTLKRGRKYEKEFREAVANLMSGVKDGTITFGNGHYNDSLGRYSNAKDKDKDVYGWAANYIYDNMRNVPKYVSQNSSKKYDSTVLGRALAKTIFGTENGNIQYFWDVDPLDQSTNTRGIDQRLGVIGEAIQQMNPDNLLGDYSDSDRATARQNLQEASRILQDGIQPGETLKLSRIFGGIDWNNWLKTDFTHRQDNQSQDPKQRFFEYISTKHPLYEGELTSQTLNQKISGGEEELLDQLLTFNKDQLLQVDINQLSNPLKESYLNLLISQGLAPLSQSEGVYIVPNSQQGESVLTYNPQNRRLERKRTHELSYYRKQWINDYIQQYGSPTDQLSQYFTEFKKNGGIIKAQGGTQLWYSGLSAAGDYDPTKYEHTYNTSALTDADMSDNMFVPWVSNIAGQGVGRYKPSEENNREYAQRIEASPYYKKFGKDLLNPDGTFTDMGLAWAKAVDAKLPKGSTATFFDEDGNLRTSWSVKNQDVYGRQPRTFNKLADYVNYVRNDNIIGSRHNVFLNQGRRYFYKDQNGVEHWVDPNEISKYVVSTNPIRSQWSDDGTIRWSDYELTGLKPDQVVPDDQEKVPVDDQRNTGSRVYPIGTQPKTSEFVGSGFGDFMLGITPDLIGTGRLFTSLRTNNRVARTLGRSLRPVLKDTYERYSPITGAFSEMQFRNRQAADLRRQASRPFTSDASLQLAGQLDASRQARDLEYQGFLADDREIRRTREAALARQEDNMARRSDVANFNRASINQTNREKAQLEATRLKRNWQSVDNFLQGVEGRLRTNLAERKALRQNSSLQLTQANYQDAIQKAGQLYKDSHPNGTTEDMLKDPQYLDRIKKLRSRYQYELYNIGQGRYLKNPYQDNVPLTYEQILSAKNGGRLRPSIMTMINKVIKNESYT